MRIILKILASACALLLVAYIVPGIEVANVLIAIIAAIFIGLTHVFVKPILLLLTLPITILTFGLFHFVINAGLFLFVASFVNGFSVASFSAAFLGSLLFSLLTTLFQMLLFKD